MHYFINKYILQAIILPLNRTWLGMRVSGMMLFSYGLTQGDFSDMKKI